MAIALNWTLEDSIRQYSAVSYRIILVRLNARPVNLNIVSVRTLVLTNEAPDDEVEEWYFHLEHLLETLPNREITKYRKIWVGRKKY